MIRMYMIDGDKWEIHSAYSGAFEGTLNQVMTYAVQEIGIEFEELEVGVEEMQKHDGHNGIEFGVLRKFLFTFESEAKKVTPNVFH